MFYFLLKYEQIRGAQRKAAGFFWHVIKMIHNYEVVGFKITFWLENLKKTSRNTVFEGEKEVPWSLNHGTD